MHSFSYHDYDYEIASPIIASKRERRQSTISSRILRIILFSVKIVHSGIGIPKNKYAFLNIVYFGLAYIWLTDQTKPNFHPSCILKTCSQKRRQCYCVFSLFTAILLAIFHNFTKLSNRLPFASHFSKIVVSLPLRITYCYNCYCRCSIKQSH